MMKLETANKRDWQGFARILEIISFVDELGDRTPDDIRDSIAGFCELPPDAGQSMNLEEVVFWAGVASGIEFWRHLEDETVDAATAEKMLVFSSLFAHSMKNAILDLALGELDPDVPQAQPKLGSHTRT